MSGYGVIADNIIYKDRAMLVREDTGIAFIFWRSQLLFIDLFLCVHIRIKNNKAI